MQEAKNERLWFKTNLKLGTLWFDREEYGRLQKILKELHRSCQQGDGSDDPKKGTQLLEVFALEIQARGRLPPSALWCVEHRVSVGWLGSHALQVGPRTPAPARRCTRRRRTTSG